MKNIKCVYKIQCIENNKVYIGQTNNYRRRINEHKSDLRNNKHSNRVLQYDYNKYGITKFTFDIIKLCNNKDELLIEETKVIDSYGGKENENVYNECDLSRHSNNYKNKQSIAQLGIHTISDQGKFNISKAHKEKCISEEQKEKIRQNARVNPNYGMKNKTHSIESKEKMRLSKQGMYLGANNPNYKYTPEFIESLRSEYLICKNYAHLSRKYNINRDTISRLIRLGKC